MSALDAIVVGSGPNGLAAALTLAERGLAVRIYEAADRPGGGLRSDELTLPGFQHDVCAAVPVMAQLSPFFRGLDLAGLGVRLRAPEVAFAHPLDDGRAAAVYADPERTAAGLGIDGPTWRRVFDPLVSAADDLWPDLLGPLRTVPHHPIELARFGLPGLRSAAGFGRARFATEPARALFAGAAAHAMRPLSAPGTAAFGLVLALTAQVANWPVVEGGTERLAEAMLRRLAQLGVEVRTGAPVTSLAELPAAGAVLLDVAPRGFLRLGGERLPTGYRRRLARYRHGPGVFKLDWALSAPVPWRADEARAAGTVHLGGTVAEIAHSEAEVAGGRHADQPYVLCVQPTIADPTRAPAGRHTLWAYCHVPSGSTRDMTAQVEAQIERFAPGFGDYILARHRRTAAEYAEYDANFVGGDINTGLATLRHVFVSPTARWNPYRTPLPGVYLCSAATPPGGGVHGMSGWHAAQSALRECF
jgi:phytoene dehydrogenase-like protein